VLKKGIKVSEETKAALDELKVHEREPYDDVIQRLLPKKKATP
jgi:predicted CopG family antitoxin